MVCVPHPVVAEETVFGEHLREIKIGLGRVEIGQLVLILVGHINIKGARLEGVYITTAEQIPVALESHPAVHAHDGQGARSVRQSIAVVRFQYIVRAVQRDFRRYVKGRIDSQGIAGAGMDDQASRTFQRGGVAEIDELAGKGQTGIRITLLCIDRQLRQALVWCANRGGGILQGLVTLDACGRIPPAVTIGQNRFLQQVGLRGGIDGAAQVAEIGVVRNAVQVDIAVQTACNGLFMDNRYAGAAASGQPVVGQYIQL